MLNFVQKGLLLDYYNSSSSVTINSGAVVVLKSGPAGQIGVAEDSIAPLSTGAVRVLQVVSLTSNGTDTGNTGDPWYWDSSAQVVTSTPNGNTTYAGRLAAPVVSTQTTAQIQLSLGVGAALPGTQTTIADPGNAGAIPVTQSGNVQIVTAGAETRTIAAPTAVGQALLICSKTHVGNCVITVASTINSTGNNTITISAAGQAIELRGIISGSTLEWAVAFNNGTALSTV